VTPRLEPEPEPAVLQENNPARPDDDSGPGDMNRVDVVPERVVEAVEQLDEGPDRCGFAGVNRRAGQHTDSNSSSHVHAVHPRIMAVTRGDDHPHR
jgi:hypothetical protein